MRLCREKAPLFDSVVLDEHIYADPGITGATPWRPQYQALLAAARARQFDVVLIEALDRLWRDQGEMHQALKRLRFYGVHVIEVTTGIDLTDRMGKIVATVQGLNAELFLENLRDKTRRGMEGTVRRGFSAGGRAYGYRSEPVRDDMGEVVGVRRVVDPAEAAVVRRIFELYDAGLGPRAIARLLNAERVPPPRPSRGRRVLGWTWTTINGSPSKAIGILNSPLFVGRVAWNRSMKVLDPDTGKRMMRPRPRSEWQWAEAPDLRIIPESLWERVQARRQGRRLVVPGNRSGRRPQCLFSGLLKCGSCGGAYTVKSLTRYACAIHHNRGPAVCTNRWRVRRDRLEERLLELIFGDVFSPETVAYVAAQVREAVMRLTSGTDERLAMRRAELARARSELENIARAIRMGVVTATTRAMLEDAERRVAELEAAVRVAPGLPSLPPVEAAVETYLRDLRATLGTDIPRARAPRPRGWADHAATGGDSACRRTRGQPGGPARVCRSGVPQ